MSRPGGSWSWVSKKRLREPHRLRPRTLQVCTSVLRGLTTPHPRRKTGAGRVAGHREWRAGTLIQGQCGDRQMMWHRRKRHTHRTSHSRGCGHVPRRVRGIPPLWCKPGLEKPPQTPSQAPLGRGGLLGHTLSRKCSYPQSWKFLNPLPPPTRADAPNTPGYQDVEGA